MARTLPGGLAALISSTTQQPTLQVTVQDYINRYSQVAGGMNAGRTDALLTSANTLIVAVCLQGTDPNHIEIARITTPATAAKWTAARTVITTNARAAAGCALGISGSTIRCFYQSNTDLKIYYRQSTDDGVTWGAETATNGALPLGLGNFCYGLATDGTTTVWGVFASYNNQQGFCSFYQTTLTSSWSAWSNVGPATPGWGLARGLASVTVSANRRLAMGVQLLAGVKGIACGVFTYNGSTWTGISAVQNWDPPDLGISLSWPGLSYDGTTYYLAIMETDDGSVSGVAQTRTNIYTSTDFAGWNLWQSLGNVFQYGAQAIVQSGVALFFDGASLYSAPTTSAPTDVSDDVLAISIDEHEGAATTATITLANQAGQWLAHPSIRTDAKVQVTLGYGTLSVLTHTLLIDRFTYDASGATMSLVLQCRNQLKLLDYAQHRLLQYSSMTLGAIVQDVARQAGVTVGSLPATAQFGYTLPCFAIQPGETWLKALERLSVAYMFAFFMDEQGVLHVQERSASDASTWTYGAEMLAVSSSYSADQANVIRVVGQQNSTFGTAIDAANLLNVGKERYRLVVERLCDTAAKCATKAALLLRDEQADAYDAQLVVAMNQQLQVNDVITFTDSCVGETARKARIQHMALHIEPEHGVWTHTLHCSGV